MHATSAGSISSSELRRNFPLKTNLDPSPSTDSHLRFGWWALLVYLTLGFILEVLHGFKIGWYLDVGQETRRLMFTLAHAHGTLLALVNIAAGVTARALGFGIGRATSRALTGASVLLPLGFFLGGVVVHGGDPGMGILLVPLGAVLLIYAVAQLAREVTKLKPRS